jgi:hypothetical protein
MISLLSDLQDLEGQEFDTALLVTYTLGLQFFEALVLPRLRRMGVSRIGILADDHGYLDSLTHPLGQSECGRSYVLSPARLPGGGIQHAKLLWLQGREWVAYVGSHNLTSAGFNDQLEVTARLTSRESAHRQALREVYEAIAPIVPRSFEYLWRHVSPPPAAEDVDGPVVRVLASVQRPIVDQFVDLVGPAEQLRVVTPFLDASALRRLADGLGAPAVVLDVPEHGADTPLVDAIDAIPNLVLRRHEPPGRRPRQLHAKAFEIRTGVQTWLALGSANCTRPALERTIYNGGNLELLLCVEGVELPTDDVQFMPIEDPASFGGTGHRWDEESQPAPRAWIDLAEYRDERLIVEWHTADHAAVEMIGIEAAGHSEVGTDSPITMALDTPPSTVTLTAWVGGAETQVRAWVNVPAELERQAGRARVFRWVDRIASDNPVQHADALSAFADQVIRDLARAAEDDRGHPQTSVMPFVTHPSAGRRAVGEAIEIFTFSQDPSRIRLAAEQLFGEAAARDPLTILRALIARFNAPPPPHVQNDVDALADYTATQRIARARAGEKLIWHLTALAAVPDGWATAPLPAVAYCLRRTFGYVTLAWHEVLSREIGEIRRGALAEAFLALLERVANDDRVRPTLQPPAVQGPLVLALGAIGEAATEDGFVREQLRRLGTRLAGGDPRQVIAAWHASDPDDVLCAGIGRSERLSHWTDASARLFGLASSQAQVRQDSRWGPLLALQDADLADDSERDRVFHQAEEHYRGRAREQPVWERYLAARRRGRLPAILRTSGTSCHNCFCTLPTKKAHDLMLGDAVICACGKILILRR